MKTKLTDNEKAIEITKTLTNGKMGTLKEALFIRKKRAIIKARPIPTQIVPNISVVIKITTAKRAIPR